MLGINLISIEIKQQLRRLRQCEYSKMKRLTQPEKIRATKKRWKINNPERCREVERDHAYGKGAHKHFVTQLEKQSNRCAVCNTAFSDTNKPHLDHEHATEQWRGALCSGCNLGLGMFNENPERLRSAAEYLINWKEAT